MKRLIMITAVLAPLACGEAKPPLLGAVVNGFVQVDGAGLPGADVFIENGGQEYDVRTDQDGRYERGNLVAGALVVSLRTRPPNVVFDRIVAMAQLEADGEQQLDFIGTTSAAVGLIHGRVTVDGAGLAFAAIQARHELPDGFGGGTAVYTASAAEDGTYRLEPVAEGNYRVELLTRPNGVEFDRTVATGFIANGATATEDFVGMTVAGPVGVAVPDSGVKVPGEDRLTNVVAFVEGNNLRFDIPIQWDPPAAGEEIQLIVGGEATGPTGEQLVADFGVDSEGNRAAVMFRRSDFSVVASVPIVGEALTDPATLTVPLRVRGSSLAASLEGIDYGINSLDVSVIRFDDAGQRVYSGVLPVELPAFIEALNGN